MMLSNLLISYVAATTSRHLRGISLKTIQDPECHTISGPDPKGTAGENCSFPFEFQNITYHGCTTVTDPDDELWCSTETNAAGLHQQGNWGYCNLTCTHLISDLSGNDGADPVGCCTCEDDPEVAAKGGNCVTLKTFFGCEMDLSILDPRAPPDTLVRTVCPSTCEVECCTCPDEVAADDDQIFINPITNAPTPFPARILDVWNPAPSPTCSDAYWFCSGYKPFCWHAWTLSNCPDTCGECHASYQLDDTLPKLRTTDPLAFQLVEDYHPIFYFDSNSCFPDYAIDRKGRPNAGLAGSSLTGGCRNKRFMSRANTYHRWLSQTANGHTYQVHVYDLYFQKDRVPYFFSLAGHRHDVETVLIYFTDGEPTHVAVSAHGSYENTIPWANLHGRTISKVQHPQIVYQSEYWNTHSFRFATLGEFGSRPGDFPPLATWTLMQGDQGYSTQRMQEAIGTFYASEGYSLKLTDREFLNQVNNPNKPAGYPQFTL